ncbi:MobA/MobL family protein [Herbaspirillum frisingense]|uniref:MobA/MobL protein domain-containing protein n=1 Tax=Herbaspirillum frisingense TaxID=92645 RepID=A0ABU1PIC7_9BURK|nr:MobA/MobL family protein [Herbaspirillum frisingense]MDR6585669.1 hypothetical protein [Herbaspirillum frisingense]
MASYHLSLKSGKRGTAANHSHYIGREGKYRPSDMPSDLKMTGFGNLPFWADHPAALWKAADAHERKNAASYRELVVALPIELTLQQQRQLVEDFIDIVLKKRPYQYAIHCPQASLADIPQPHAHIMFCDRIDDGLPRMAASYFRRYNAATPALGGAKKENGGKTPQEVREFMQELRKTWANMQNHALQAQGHLSRVDHRSHAERGICTQPETHLGPYQARKMTLAERCRLFAQRAKDAFQTESAKDSQRFITMRPGPQSRQEDSVR